MVNKLLLLLLLLTTDHLHLLEDIIGLWYHIRDQQLPRVFSSEMAETPFLAQFCPDLPIFGSPHFLMKTTFLHSIDPELHAGFDKTHDVM